MKSVFENLRLYSRDEILAKEMPKWFWGRYKSLYHYDYIDTDVAFDLSEIGADPQILVLSLLNNYGVWDTPWRSDMVIKEYIVKHVTSHLPSMRDYMDNIEYRALMLMYLIVTTESNNLVRHMLAVFFSHITHIINIRDIISYKYTIIGSKDPIKYAKFNDLILLLEDLKKNKSQNYHRLSIPLKEFLDKFTDLNTDELITKMEKHKIYGIRSLYGEVCRDRGLLRKGGVPFLTYYSYSQFLALDILFSEPRSFKGVCSHCYLKTLLSEWKCQLHPTSKLVTQIELEPPPSGLVTQHKLDINPPPSAPELEPPSAPELESDSKCCICFENAIKIAVIPCFHCYCSNCVTVSTEACPQCRQKIERIQTLYY